MRIRDSCNPRRLEDDLKCSKAICENYSSKVGGWLETRCNSVTCSNCRRPAPNMTWLWNVCVCVNVCAEPPGRQSCCFEAIAGSLRPTAAAARGVSDEPS